MSVVVTGAPEPEVVAAIIACVDAVIASQGPAPVPRPVSAWRQAAILEGLRGAPPVRPGAGWRPTADQP